MDANNQQAEALHRHHHQCTTTTSTATTTTCKKATFKFLASGEQRHQHVCFGNANSSGCSEVRAHGVLEFSCTRSAVLPCEQAFATRCLPRHEDSPVNLPSEKIQQLFHRNLSQFSQAPVSRLIIFMWKQHQRVHRCRMMQACPASWTTRSMSSHSWKPMKS